MSVRNRRIKTTCSAVCLIVLGALGGCANFKVAEDAAWPDSILGWPQSKPKFKVPTHVTAMWTHTVLNQPDQPGVRGFGGRVMFYAEDSQEPVMVDGTVTVYAFDAANDDPNHAAPERKYVFPAEQLPDHYSESKLGHSYSFWLPWDELGGRQRQISLIIRFEPRDGGMVVSKSSRQVLPGIISKLDEHSPSPTGIRQVVHEAPAAEPKEENPPGQQAMSTITINVPPNFVRRGVTAAEFPQWSPPQHLGLQKPSPSHAPAANPSPVTLDYRAAASPHRGESPQTTSQATSPSGGSARSRFPARKVPAARQGSGRVRRQPLPATWPSGLPATPRSNRSPQWRWSRSAGQPSLNESSPGAAE